MFRPAAILVALALAACAEEQGLAERAETRLESGDADGAERLAERALEQDPSNARALAVHVALYAGSPNSSYTYPRGSRPRRPAVCLRYLRDARPLDGAEALWCLSALRGSVFDLPDEALAAVGAAHAHRDALRAIHRRFQEERVDSPVAWARLAVLLRAVGGGDAAEAAMERAQPRDLSEWAGVTECAMHALCEPAEWWREHGEPMLAEQATRGALDDDALLVRLLAACDAARERLVEDRDLDGVVRLLRLQCRVWPVGYRYFQLEWTAEAIARGWFLEETYAALEGDDDPIVACLRAHILFEMLQDDLGLAELNRVLADHPDCLEAIEGRWHFLVRAGRLSESEREADHLAERAAALGVPVNDWVAFERVRVAYVLAGAEEAADRTARLLETIRSHSLLSHLLKFWADKTSELPRIEPDRPMPPSLAAPLAQAIVRINVTPESYWGGLGRGEAARLFAAGGEHDRAIEWIAAQPANTARTIGLLMRSALRQGVGFASTRAVLACAAARPSPGEAEDAFLRALCVTPPSEGVPLRLVRIRMDLETDAAFMRRPAAGYVLSLLCDEVFERERAMRSRADAYAAGCRTRGLLRDLARDGEDVLDELAAVDPTEARLGRALRSGDLALLQAFLEEEDRATTEQRREAEETIAHVRGERVLGPSPPEEASSGDPLESVFLWNLREVFEGVQLSPEVRAGLDAALARAEGFTRAGMTLQHRLESERDGLVYLPDTPEVAALAAVEDREAKADRAAELAKEHPLDLRWDAMEQEGDLAVGALARIAAARTGNAAFLSWAVSQTEDERTVHDAEMRVLELRRDDPIAAVMEGFSSFPEDPSVIEACRERARTPRDTLAIFLRTRHVGLREVAKELEADVRACQDPAIRLAALEGDEAVAAAREAALGEKTLRRTILARLRAARPGDERALEALQELWESCPPDETDLHLLDGVPLTPGGVAGTLGEQLAKRAEAPEAPAWAWFFLYRAAIHNSQGRDLLLRASEALAQRGYFERSMWAGSLQSMGKEKALEACTRATSRLAPGREALDAVTWVHRAACDLASSPEIATGLADAWAERVGDVVIADGVRSWGQIGSAITSLPRPGPQGGVVPREFLAGLVLDAAGLHAEATGRFQSAERRAVSPWVRDACLVAQVDGVRREWLHSRYSGRSDALPIPVIDALIALERGASSQETREWARTELDDVFEEVVARGAAVELLVALGARGPAPEAAEVARWEARLGSQDFTERDAASTELASRGAKALPLLAALRRSQDAEVQARAEELLRQLGHREEEDLDEAGE